MAGRISEKKELLYQKKRAAEDEKFRKALVEGYKTGVYGASSEISPLKIVEKLAVAVQRGKFIDIVTLSLLLHATVDDALQQNKTVKPRLD